MQSDKTSELMITLGQSDNRDKHVRETRAITQSLIPITQCH